MVEGTPVFTPLQTQALQLREIYEAWREAGFTQEETIQYLVGLTRRSATNGC